jgi:transcriptional regulator with XRE-family HTH domain
MLPPKRERVFAAIRRAAGLDLTHAAIRLGVHPRYLRQVETAQRPLSLALAERMAREYGASIGDLTRPAGAGGTSNGRGGSGSPPRPVGRPCAAGEGDR